MPVPSLFLLNRNTWPFVRAADRQQPRRAQTGEGLSRGRADVDNVADPRHADNSSRARAIRSEYRHALRDGEMPPHPTRPPGYDDAVSPPPYQDTPRAGEITVDHNSRIRPRDLRHPHTASQGLSATGSENYGDFQNPFRSQGRRNPAAPAYPDPAPTESSAQPPEIRYLPFPHEKEQSLTDVLRGRPTGMESDYQPPSDRPGAPRRGPTVEPQRHRLRVDWRAVMRGVVNGLSAMGGGPMGPHM